jgi:hypothetical protein
MGYDITFHPVKFTDIQRYLFDVVDDFSLAEARARELATDNKDFEMINKFYYKELEKRLHEIREQEAKGEPAVSCWFARTTAALAGFRYPYWYCRGSALSFIAKEDPKLHALITPITKCGKGKVAGYTDSSRGLITSNYTASGLFAKPELILKEIPRLSQDREKAGLLGSGKATLPSLMSSVFDNEGRDALQRAVNYCQKHSLGMIEAADVYSPIAGGGSRYENLRAAFNHSIDKPD